LTYDLIFPSTLRLWQDEVANAFALPICTQADGIHHPNSFVSGGMSV
jgi:hypothetical protein